MSATLTGSTAVALCILTAASISAKVIDSNMFAEYVPIASCESARVIPSETTVINAARTEEESKHEEIDSVTAALVVLKPAAVSAIVTASVTDAAKKISLANEEKGV